MSTQKFHSRSGCVDYGNSYEYLMSAYYGLLLSFNNCVGDFKISVNNIDLGNFDDVILEVTYTDGEQHLYALQLKHHGVQNGRITPEAFNGSEGDFSLKKYSKGFSECQENYLSKATSSIPFENFYFIVYTNQHLKKFEKFVNKKKVDTDEILLKSKITIYKYDKCVSRGFLDLSESDDFFIYKFKNNGNRDFGNDQFFQQFYLYTKQKDAKDIEIHISNYIRALIDSWDPNIVTNFINFFKFWWRGDFGKFKLTKKDIIVKLSEYILTPYIPDINFNILHSDREKFLILKEFMFCCDLTLVEPFDDIEEILWSLILKDEFGDADFSLWDQPFSTENKNNLPKLSKIPISAHGENFIEQSLKKIYIILWHMDRLPLFLKVNLKARKQIYTAIKLCHSFHKPKRFIVLDESIEEEEFGNSIKIFRKLADIDNERIYNSLCEHIDISIQGKSPLKLKQILEIDDSFKDVIKVKDLIFFIKTNRLVGANHNIPKHYINRLIPKMLLKLKVIDEVDDVFVVSCENPMSCSLESTSFDLSRYFLLKENATTNHFSEKFYISVNGICSSADFRKICDLNRGKNCHHVKFVGNNLEWLESEGNIGFLKPYKLDYKDFKAEDFVPDSKILSYFYNKTNVLCAPAGMGKSSLLKYLRSASSPDFWVVYTNLNDHAKFLRENHNILDISYHFLTKEIYDDFTSDFVAILLSKRKVLYLWDGFDELSSSSLSSVISVIKLLSERGYTQWIVARSNFEEYIENIFGLFAMTVTPFSEEDRQHYIHNRLKEKYGDKTGQDMVAHLNKKMSLSLNCGYFDYNGIPLQLYMTLEIFLKNAERYMDVIKIVTLTDLYREYIDGKFLDLYERANINNHNFLMQKIQKKFKETQELNYELAAVKASFQQESSPFLTPSHDEFLQKIAQNGDKLGLIFGLNDDNKPIFSHRTYQEFLTASWLAKNFKIVPVIMKKLFKDDYKNIRLMFDMILAKDSSVHVAVLYRNIQVLKDCQGEVLNSKDKGGRNPLHIACSWGTKHPLVKVVDSDSEKMVISVDDITEDYDSNVEIVKLLISLGFDPLETDDLYHWNSIKYCDQTMSLALLEHILSVSLKVDLSDLSNFNDEKTVFYYSILYNYTNLFSCMKQYQYVELMEGEDTRTLLHFAVKMDRINFVANMLSFPHYQKVINKPYKDFGAPLVSAASNGNLEMFRLLQKHGAQLDRNQTSPLVFAVAMGYIEFCQKLLTEDQLDPNQYNIDGCSILQVAALKGYTGIMELLLQHGADVDYVNYMDHTALDFAIDRRSVDGVKLLVRSGADVNRKGNTLYGYTALHNACELENEEIVKFLLENGADTKVKSNMLYTPLHVALINRQKHIARILIEADPSVINEYSVEKSTPIILSALEDYHDMIELLATLGADVNSEHTPDSPLRIATLKKFQKSVTVLIKCGASVNKPDKYGFTPLFYAVGSQPILKLYLDCDKTDVNARSFYSVTALHFAAQNEKIEAVQQLILHGADVNAKDSKNETPLHYAIAAKDEKIVKLLLKCDLKIVDGFSLLNHACVHDVPDCLLALINAGISVNSADDQYRTALYSAVTKSLFCTKILIKKGADVNIMDSFGLSPLTFAVFSGKIDIIKEILHAEGDINKGFGSSAALHLAAALGNATTLVFLIAAGCSLNAQDAHGRTALHCVVEKDPGFPFGSIIRFMSSNKLNLELERNYEKCADELLEKEADVGILNQFGLSPIVSAAACNNLEMVKLFWKKFNNECAFYWKQCLFIASRQNFLPIIEFLYYNKIVDVVNDRDEKYQMTALHCACSNSAQDTVTFLISKGVNINAEMIDGSTPLYLSASLGNFELVKLLVENGAVIDAAHKHGNTSLFAASFRGFYNVVKFLCDNGANVNVVDEDGDTPLHDAAAKGHLSVVQYLVSKGANITKNKNDKTPLDLATDNKMTEIAKFLEEI